MNTVSTPALSGLVSQVVTSVLGGFWFGVGFILAAALLKAVFKLSILG